VIKPAKNFEKFIEYDLSKMTDSKGGFLSQADDPNNRALHDGAPDPLAGKPANMTMEEWERHIILQKLRTQRAGPFEPGISVLDDDDKRKSCRECGALEIDWRWLDVFDVAVCNACKEKLPDRYSLLTKTEAREDYLLTNRELAVYIFRNANGPSRAARRGITPSLKEAKSTQINVE
jgi:DNA-repair protein complementing XP-A cells